MSPPDRYLSLTVAPWKRALRSRQLRPPNSVLDLPKRRSLRESHNGIEIDYVEGNFYRVASRHGHFDHEARVVSALVQYGVF
jgi:hypothetical protein